jgi:hypothetical protein
MPGVLYPGRFVFIAVAMWMQQRQPRIMDHLREENRDAVFQSTASHASVVRRRS